MKSMTSVDYPETGHDWCAAVEDDSWWFAHRSRVLLEVMRRYPPAPPLYDVGGGNGAVAAALQRGGIRAIVVEPGEAGVRRARGRGLESIRATLDDAPLAVGTVGSIGMFDVLEHIEQPLPFLRRAAALLRGDGRIYVTVPAYASLWSADDDFARHYRRYTRRTLGRQLADAGLALEMSTYLFALLPLPILAFRTIPYRFRRPRRISAEAVERDHRASSGLSRAAIDSVLSAELTLIRRGITIPFGASVLAVGRKPGQAPARLMAVARPDPKSVPNRRQTEPNSLALCDHPCKTRQKRAGFAPSVSF